MATTTTTTTTTTTPALSRQKSPSPSPTTTTTTTTTKTTSIMAKKKNKKKKKVGISQANKKSKKVELKEEEPLGIFVEKKSRSNIFPAINPKYFDKYVGQELDARKTNTFCQFDIEFGVLQKLSKKKRTQEGFLYRCPGGCARKNRYADIIPVAETRVKLQSSDDSDYINANWIGDKTNSEKNVICGQAPTRESIDDFWNMVWDENVNVIVMLTKLKEKGRPKANKYWPVGKGKWPCDGDILVIVSKDKSHPKLRNSTELKSQKFELYKNGCMRDLFHIQYKSWPDQGQPQTYDTLKKVYQDVKAFQEYQGQDGDTGKLVVHCSAGIGRAGVYMSIQCAMQQLYKYQNRNKKSKSNKGVSIFGIVRKLRTQRSPSTVQTIGQYLYVYKFIQNILQDEKTPVSTYLPDPSLFWM